ncbi:hypothetical protein [Acrocarpospora macrocephala]|nr:hypothetical protein [Acrocarpospora macrocephala]
MPLPIFGMKTEDRGSGMVPPPVALEGPTELRVHGVGGSTPQHLLADSAPQQVGGDHISGFYRTADAGGRHVEGYSWGGLTSRSGVRVLWLLLLPFALANLAGWMWPFTVTRTARRFAMFRVVARLAALALTVNVVLLVSAVAMDYVGYQCGGNIKCADSWWISPFRMASVASFPGRRILLGAVVPLLLLVLLAVLTYRTQRRYESVRPPGSPGPRRPCVQNAASLEGGLRNLDFWNTGRYTRYLGEIHIAAGLALLALMVATTVHGTLESAPGMRIGAGQSLAPEWLWSGSVWIAVAVLIVAVLAVIPEKVIGPLRWLGLILTVLAIGALLLAGAMALLEPAMTAVVPNAVTPHELPGLRPVMNWVYGGIIVALLLVPVCLIAAALDRKKPLRTVQLIVVAAALVGMYFMLDVIDRPYGWVIVALIVAIGIIVVGVVNSGQAFRWGAPFMVLTIAFGLANTVLVGLIVRVADTLGEIKYTFAATEPVPDNGRIIAVFPVISDVAAYLIFEPVILILIFAGWQAIRWWRAGRSKPAQVIADEYYEKEQPLPDDRGWVASTVKLNGGAFNPDWATPEMRAWPGRVSRARKLAELPRDLDLLFTSIVVIGILLFAWLEMHIWADDIRRPSPWAASLGTAIATLLPLAALLLARAGWQNHKTRRVIGVLWDVGTFWPRGYHPLAPPSYAERAVPELQRRMWFLHDSGAQILLAAHSQGAILAAAALSQDGQDQVRPTGMKVVLATFGSPMRKLYSWGFPAYFTEEITQSLLPQNGTTSTWRNFYYLTDYIGGWIVDDGENSVDKKLPDPPTCQFTYGDAPPQIGSHTGYWKDPSMWREIDLIAPGPPTANHL